MADRLDGMRRKIERADKHIGELHGAIKEWTDTDPYLVVPEDDLDAGDKVYRVRIREQPPADRWSPIIGDAIHNLRSALDLLVYQLVLANGKTPYTGNGFPIYETEAEYKAKLPGKVQGTAKKARKVIDGCKPYKAGNLGLWQLHALDIIDKHRLLVTAVASHTGLILDLGKSMPFPEGHRPSIEIGLRPAEGCPLKDGDEVYRVTGGANSEPDDDPKFTFDIAIHEPGVVECEPVLPFLGQLMSLVNSTIPLFRSFLT